MVKRALPNVRARDSEVHLENLLVEVAISIAIRLAVLSRVVAINRIATKKGT